MQSIQFRICIIISFVLIGCVPNATMYYRPTVDVESTHEKSHCVPTEKYVHFNIKVKNKSFRVRGYGNTYSHSWGEGTEVQLVVQGKWDEIKYKNDYFYITSPERNEKVTPKKIYGKVHKHNGESSFNFGAVFPKHDGDRFDAFFPPLIIDGEEVELPVLHIKKTIWIGISPFNC